MEKVLSQILDGNEVEFEAHQCPSLVLATLLYYILGCPRRYKNEQPQLAHPVSPGDADVAAFQQAKSMWMDNDWLDQIINQSY